MKKVWTRMICSVLLFACCILPSTAMAVEGKEANVIVTVEHEEKDIFEMYGNVFEESMVKSRKSTVDLSSGSVAFTVGVLDAGEKYTTDTYDISKSKIKVTLQSIGGASPHVKVTLYKSSGVSVATSTVNLPWSTPLGGGGSETVTFSNLNSSTNYYAVIENMDTVETGTILCVVKQGVSGEGRWTVNFTVHLPSLVITVYPLRYA